jgi:hypothetical protein
VKLIDEERVFAGYPALKNGEELKKADVLVLPEYVRAFASSQHIFRELASETDTDCRFYSEDQDVLTVYRENSAEYIPLLGGVVSTIASLIKIYEFLEKRMAGERFRIKHTIKISDGSYFEMTEFEGTIHEYQAVVNAMRSHPEFRSR